MKDGALGRETWGLLGRLTRGLGWDTRGLGRDTRGALGRETLGLG